MGRLIMNRFRKKRSLTFFYRLSAVGLFVFVFACGGGGSGEGSEKDNTLIIGGFNSSRGGDASITDGLLHEGLRVVIYDAFPGTVFTSSAEITDSYLSSIDILLLVSATTCCSEIDPLTKEEQDAVLRFVEAGKGMLIFSDSENFGSPLTDSANESLIDPFGLDIEGTLEWEQNATITDPTAHPVTSGPFGQISTIHLYFPGWFTDLGPHAISLATMDGSGADVLAVINAGAISPTSGRVVLFSDIITTPAHLGDLLRKNEALILNSIAFVGNINH
jgi:hypothetical protein